MNNLEFMAVLVARNELAHAVCVELSKARANQENNLREVANGWYDFVHAVVYENDSRASIFRGNDHSYAFSKQAEEQLIRFWQKDNAEVRRAFLIWYSMDNGEFGGI